MLKLVRNHGKGKKGKRYPNGENGIDQPIIIRLGICPRCKRENVEMSSHHIYPRWVFGPNGRTNEDFPKLVNDVTKPLCRDCHDEMEDVNRELEAMILRPFQFCFRKAYNEFMQKDKVTNGDLFVIAMAGFVKVFTRSMGSCATDIRSWLRFRMRTPGVSLRKTKEKRQY